MIPWDGHDYDRAMVNKNKMLTLYEGGNGVKTGYTKQAGRCLVSGALREGMQLICVVLNCPDMWNDSMALLDQAFAEAELVDVLDPLLPVCRLPAGENETLGLLPAEAVSVPLLEGESADIHLQLPERVDLPVARGETLGYASVCVGAEELMRVPLYADRDVQPPSPRLRDSLRSILSRWCPGEPGRGEDE